MNHFSGAQSMRMRRKNGLRSLKLLWCGIPMNLIIINMLATKTNQGKNAYIIIIFVFVKFTWISDIHFQEHILSHDKNQYSNEDAHYCVFPFVKRCKGNLNFSASRF